MIGEKEAERRDARRRASAPGILDDRTMPGLENRAHTYTQAPSKREAEVSSLSGNRAQHPVYKLYSDGPTGTKKKKIKREKQPVVLDSMLALWKNE